MPFEELLETRIYKEWIQPQGLIDFASVVLDRSTGYVYVEGDVNGNAKADFQIKVEGVRGLDAGDFLL